LAGLAYQSLHAKGYRNLRVLDEGIPGWIQQGYPTEGTVSGYVPDHTRDYQMLSGARLPPSRP
jgi:3-mercaptopyruvate sulfurtransferase SseA